MSLIRTAVVLSAAIMLLPSDKGRQQQLFAQAASTVQDAATYCDRNAETCAKAAEYFELFKEKAAFAGELAFEALQRYQVNSQSAAIAEPTTSLPAVSKRGTLTDKDLEPSWRATVRRQGI